MKLRILTVFYDCIQKKSYFLFLEYFWNVYMLTKTYV